MTQLYDNALEQFGLRITQLAILGELALRASNPPTMAVLAEALVLERSSLGHNLQALVERNLATMEPDPADKRRRLIRLTGDGLALLRQALPFWQKAQEHFLGVVGEVRGTELREQLLDIAADERLSALPKAIGG